jgi:hypothetical protein
VPSAAVASIARTAILVIVRIISTLSLRSGLAAPAVAGELVDVGGCLVEELVGGV